jgi:hypothetical protein
LYAHVLAELLEKAETEADSWWSKIKGKLFSRVDHRKTLDEKIFCVSNIVSQWSARAETGIYSSTNELLTQWLNSFHGSEQCLKIAKAIVGPESKDFIHGEFLNSLMEAELQFRINSQKKAHLQALRLLLSQPAEQFPRAAQQILMFYMEDSDPEISNTARIQLAQLENHYKVRGILDFISPDAITGYASLGMGAATGAAKLANYSSKALRNLLRAEGLAGSLALHLGAAKIALSQNPLKAAPAYGIRNEDGKDKPFSEDKENDFGDVKAFNISFMQYDLFNPLLLRLWAEKSRSDYLNSRKEVQKHSFKRYEAV